MLMFVSTLVLGVGLLQTVYGDLSEAELCLEGPYHKHHSSPETQDFQECHAFKNNSCCQFHIADEIYRHDATNLYDGYHWNLCGPLTAECEAFIADEECFYQCEPSLYYFADPAYPGKGYIKGVPICADYCDAWFAACRRDKTCVVDWLSDFEYDQSEYKCPNGSACRTFEDVYTNGEGLCTTMWGSAFKYETDASKCMLMNFPITTGCKNPNACARDDVQCTVENYKGCDLTSAASQIFAQFIVTLIYYIV